MTAHQAKGKEFDYGDPREPVERHYPNTEEGRRLFYVAVTHATARWVVVAPNAKRHAAFSRSLGSSVRHV